MGGVGGEVCVCDMAGCLVTSLLLPGVRDRGFLAFAQLGVEKEWYNCLIYDDGIFDYGDVIYGELTFWM